MKSQKSIMPILMGATLVVFGLAFLRTHMRIQATLIGYELGRLKSTESALLEEQSQLKMKYAKLTSKQHLSLMSSKSPGTKASSTVAYLR